MKKIISVSIAFLLLFLLSEKAYSAADPFVIKNIKIFAEAEDLESAKLKALYDGFLKGFSELVENVTPSTVKWRADTIDASEITGLIQRHDVVFENKTSNSYRATINVTFSKNAIKKRFLKLGLLYAQYYNSPTLVIPLTIKNGKTLFLQSNQWEKAWTKSPEKKGLLSFQYLLNDLTDQTYLNAINLTNPSYEEFINLLKHYNADNVVIAILFEDEKQLNININEIGKTYKSMWKKSFPYPGNDPTKWDDIINNITTNIDDHYKSFYQ